MKKALKIGIMGMIGFIFPCHYGGCDAGIVLVQPGTDDGRLCLRECVV